MKSFRPQQEEIEKLQENFRALKEWSDLNDYWLKEMIDALIESVDKNFDRIIENKYMIEMMNK